MSYALFDQVILAVDLPELGLRAGTRGTVVEALGAPPAEYAVEFFDDQGKTIDWVVLGNEQLRIDTERIGTTSDINSARDS